jgi:hypothetical protein
MKLSAMIEVVSVFRMLKRVVMGDVVSGMAFMLMA